MSSVTVLKGKKEVVITVDEMVKNIKSNFILKKLPTHEAVAFAIIKRGCKFKDTKEELAKFESFVDSVHNVFHPKVKKVS